MSKLRIAPDLALPGEEAITRSFGFLGMRGSGKSNGAVVLAEEMFHAGLPWVAIDPKGDWWGIRSSQDGAGKGLPVVIFGGDHQDVPLEPTAAAGVLVADLILNEHITAILDLSMMSKNQKVSFLAGNGSQEGFAGRLYRMKKREQGGLHVFLEEAHDYVPQQARGELGKMIDVVSSLQTMGRTRGIGCSVVSQRSARVHKDVLTQIDTLVAFRTISPQDRAAIEDWVKGHGVTRELIDSLPSLADGESWIWSPEWLGSLSRVHWRRRATYDSGATPVGVNAPRRPATLADVDLGAINEKMAATIERAAADDPRSLRRQVADLEAQLARKDPPKTVVEKVSVLDEEDHRLIDELILQLEAVATLVGPMRDLLVSRLADIKAPAAPRPAPVIPAAGTVDNRQPGGQSGPDLARTEAPQDFRLGKADQTFLGALAQHRDGLTQSQLALITGYSSRSGHFANVLGRLRSTGLITRGWPAQITPEGLVVAPEVDGLPRPGPDLVAYWLGRVGKADRAMLEVFVTDYPGEVTKDELGQRAGYSPTSGHFANVLGRLRTLGLVDGWKASADLMGQ